MKFVCYEKLIFLKIRFIIIYALSGYTIFVWNIFPYLLYFSRCEN